MKKFFNRLQKSTAIAIVLAAIAIVSVGAAVVYNLNQTVPATVTINEPPPTQVDVQLASDILGTPFSGTLNFGTFDPTGYPQTSLYFDASKINPSTINLSSSGGPTVNYIVGTPSASTHFCPIVIWLSNLTPGTFNFDITVTGSNI